MTAAVRDVPQIVLDRTPCVMCGGQQIEVIYRALRDVRYGRSEEFALVRCHGCGLCRLDPRPDRAALQRFYDPERYVPFRPAGPQRSAPQDRIRAVLALPYRFRYGPLESCPSPPNPASKMLDVGCGPGLRLAAMSSRGWNAYGIEPDARAADRAAAVVGARGRVVAASVEATEFADGMFDLITASHVLEHLADPLGTLRQLHSWLAPGGTLLLWVPNFASAERRVFGRNWAALDVPRHLYHFSLATIATALRTTGFDVRGWRPQFQGSSFGDSVRQSLHARTGLTGPSPATGRLYQACSALGWLLAGLGNTASIEVCATRR